MQPNSIHRILRVVAFPIAIAVATIAVADEPPTTPEEIVAWLNVPSPPRPELPLDVAQRIAAIDEAYDEADDAGRHDEAIAIAEEALALRLEHQSGWTDADGTPAEWHEIGLERRAIAYQRHLASAGAAARAALREADDLTDEINEHVERGASAEAIDLSRRQLEIRRRLLGDEHVRTLFSMATLGSRLYEAAQWAEAERVSRAALEGRRRVLGAEHPQTLASMKLMGLLRLTQGRYSEAEPHLWQALHGGRRVLGDEHSQTLLSMSYLGRVLRLQAKLREAEPLFRRLLEVRTRTLGSEHPDTLSAVNLIGVVLWDQGNYEQVEPLFRQNLEIRRRTLGNDDRATLVSVANMGSLLAMTDRSAEAELYFRQTVGDHRRILGDDARDTLFVIDMLGSYLVVQGKLTEAERCFREALEGRRRLHGADHRLTLNSMNGLGRVLDWSGRLDEAEPFYHEALTRRRATLGTDHRQTLTSINNMGTLRRKQGRLAEAETFYRQALEGQRRVLGDDHSDTLLSLKNLGLLFLAAGKPAEAEPFFREVLERAEDAQTKLDSLHGLALALRAQGRTGEAEPFLQSALDLVERKRAEATGGERGSAAIARRFGLSAIAADLAILLARAGRHREAWTVAERGRSRALLDLLARSEADIASRVADSGRLEAARAAEAGARLDLIAAQRRLAALQRERRTYEALDDTDEAIRTDRVASLDETIDAYYETIERRRSDLDDATTRVLLELQDALPVADPLDAAAIQQQLDAGEVLLGYVWSEETVVLLTASPARLDAIVLADGRDEVDALTTAAAAVRNAMSDRHTRYASSPAREASSRLAERLLPDSARATIAAATRVVILPDGPMTGIPLDALEFDQDDPALGDGRVQIAYASSATLYLDRRRVGREKIGGLGSNVVALGDPDFHREDTTEPALPLQGALVSRAAEGGIAAAAGITRGDVILSYAGTDVRDRDHLLALNAEVGTELETGTRTANDPLVVEYWRSGAVRQTTITPGLLGVDVDLTSPHLGLRAMAEASRGIDERLARASMLDLVRLYEGELSDLRGSGKEVRNIAMIAEAAGLRTTKLLGPDATIGKLERAVETARYVHIATHGFTGSATRPYDACLALSAPETPTVDDIGFVTLDHLIRNWRGKLAACDLVVLSACDTQRGVREGDSIMSLPWGFFYAGAPTVVASLWRIDDEATALLMKRFYENLLGEHADETRTICGVTYGLGEVMPKADALQEAKRWLRAHEVEDRGVVRVPGRPVESRRPYEHPCYWAAFVLVGDPE